MKNKVNNEDKRNKAFLGAVIGAVGGIAGGIISKRRQKKAAEKAYRQAQIDQTRNEGFQQAAAMSSQYANQDYVDEYNNKITLKRGGKVNIKRRDTDRITLAKRFKCGGRKKAGLGTDIINDFKNIGQEFKGDNLKNTIVSSLNGLSNAFNSANGSSQTLNDINNIAMNTIQRNKDIAQQADARKLQQQPIAKFGCRKKGLFGVGAAIGGISSIIGGATSSTNIPKQVKVSNGFGYDVPKIGIERNSYDVADTNNIYTDRLNQAKMGMRKRTKCK
nr:MAG TPA: hypothetical protein [Crassvirales sp.]